MKLLLPLVLLVAAPSLPARQAAAYRKDPYITGVINNNAPYNIRCEYTTYDPISGTVYDDEKFLVIPGGSYTTAPTFIEGNPAISLYWQTGPAYATMGFQAVTPNGTYPGGVACNAITLQQKGTYYYSSNTDVNGYGNWNFNFKTSCP
jgi:hypothetical protein